MVYMNDQFLLKCKFVRSEYQVLDIYGYSQGKSNRGQIWTDSDLNFGSNLSR